MINKRKVILEATAKFVFFIIAWILFLIVKIPTVILGLVAVIFLWQYRSTYYRNLKSWTRPWANPEDWKGGPQSYENSLPEWWVIKHLSVYAHWWHRIVNIFKHKYKPTGTKNRGAKFWSFYKYHALRNPANGLRSYELLDLDIDMARVKYITNIMMTYYEPRDMRNLLKARKTAAYICWQGLKAGVKIVHLWNDKKHFVLKIGWRIEPKDQQQMPTGIRSIDAGFATKFLPYRKG